MSSTTGTSASDTMYTHRIVWSGGADSAVIATGQFDDWKGTVLLDKGSDGNWAADVRVPYGARDVNFKFVVDGTWRHSDDLPKHQDEGGNVNNVFHVPASAPELDSTPDTNTATDTITSNGVQLAKTNGKGAGSDADTDADGNAAEAAAEDAADVTELASTGVMAQHSQEQEERKSSSNLPTSLQELLGSMSVSNGSGDGSGGVQVLNGNRSGYGSNGYQQIDMSHAAYIKHLENAARAYPSPYLLHFTDPSEPTPPTDLQVACEYITIRHAAFMDGLERLTEQDKLKGIVPEPIGILKILPKIKEKYPNWTLSEKRLRKIIKDEEVLAQAERAARLAGELGGGRFQAEVVPVSSIDERLVEDLKGNPALQAARNKAAASANEQEKREEAARKARESLLGAELGADKENTLPLPNTSGGSKKKGSKRAKSSAAPVSGVLSAVGDAVTSAAETAASAIASALPAAPTNIRDEPKGPTNIVGDVDVKWYDDVKGKGVIASKRIKKHTVIFREDAFVFGPTRTIQSAINEGNGCGYCGKLFLGKASSIIVPCTAHDSIPANGGLAPTAANGQRKVSAGKKTTRSVSSSGTGKKGAQAESQLAANAVQAVAAGKGSSCSLKFCNKLCRDRCNESYSSLLCPVVNPSLSAFLKWSDESEGGSEVGRQGSLAVFKMYLRLIVASQRDGFMPADVSAASSAITSAPPLSGKEILERLEALATISERTRKKRELGMFADMQMGEDWLTGFRLTLEALQLPEKYYTPHAVPGAPTVESRPANPGETIQRAPAGALPDWYQKDLPVELTDRIFGFQNFLVWWGRVGLNQEDDGGIYILHPCINHDCEPNATVKRTPSMNNVGAKEAKPSKIYVVAHRDIEKGEEITVTYVSPSATFDQRQGKLRASYLFDCFCGRCVAQAAEKGYTLKPRDEGASALPGGEDDKAQPAAPAKSSSSKNKKSGKAKKSAAVPASSSVSGAAESTGDDTSRPQTIQEQEQELFGDDSESTTPWYEDA